MRSHGRSFNKTHFLDLSLPERPVLSWEQAIGSLRSRSASTRRLTMELHSTSEQWASVRTCFQLQGFSGLPLHRPACFGDCAVLPGVSFSSSCLFFLSTCCSVPLSTPHHPVGWIHWPIKHSICPQRIYLLYTDIKLCCHTFRQTFIQVTCDAPKCHGRCGHARWDAVTPA